MCGDMVVVVRNFLPPFLYKYRFLASKPSSGVGTRSSRSTRSRRPARLASVQCNFFQHDFVTPLNYDAKNLSDSFSTRIIYLRSSVMQQSCNCSTARAVINSNLVQCKKKKIFCRINSVVFLQYFPLFWSLYTLTVISIEKSDKK